MDILNSRVVDFKQTEQEDGTTMYTVVYITAACDVLYTIKAIGDGDKLAVLDSLVGSFEIPEAYLEDSERTGWVLVKYRNEPRSFCDFTLYLELGPAHGGGVGGVRSRQATILILPTCMGRRPTD
jgi:hypothetical protein